MVVAAGSTGDRRSAATVVRTVALTPFAPVTTTAHTPTSTAVRLRTFALTVALTTPGQFVAVNGPVPVSATAPVAPSAS
jgi:hypothetical protein